MTERAFRNLYNHGFVRVAAAAPRVHAADPAANARETLALAERAHEAGAALLVCPELGLTGYALDDLHLQAALLEAARAAIADIARATRASPLVLALGAPLRVGDRIFNCAVIVQRGAVLGVVPKTYLPNYREFYEKRQFAAARDAIEDHVDLAGQRVPFGVDLLFRAEDAPDCVFAFEICEDVWAAIPPSTYAAFAGATVLANLSASNIVIGKAETRNLLCAAHSARCLSGYLYSASGRGESTTDLAWDGHLAAFELGETLAEAERFQEGSTLLCADIDVERIALERARTPTFRDAAFDARRPFREVRLTLAPERARLLPLRRPIARFPYVPADPARLDRDCFEAVNIQAQGLRQRLEAARVERAVIGVSGGLDSTHALLVACRAADAMGWPRTRVIGVTLPGFATGEASKANAWTLMRELRVDGREVDIRPLARQLLADLKHPFARGEPVHDVTFENVQAGVRTDFLFRLANLERGLVVGTGDLSELALGWCTYGVGDQMAHYNVNASVAKTLIQHLIRWVALSGQVSAAAAQTLEAILAQEISPELVPPGADGAPQSTEAAIGPYNLHDFFLYYATRYGLGPAKIAFLAETAWANANAGAWPAEIPPDRRVAYDIAAVLRWLAVFAERFYATSQYKRSAMPNGPKISSGGALSPRGDWRAPSDASAAPWLAEIARTQAWVARMAAEDSA